MRPVTRAFDPYYVRAGRFTWQEREPPRLAAYNPESVSVPFFLVLTTGRGVVTIPLPVAESSDVGRDPACAIVVPDGSVSRVHARIHRADGIVTIEDLGSRNGTFV